MILLSPQPFTRKLRFIIELRAGLLAFHFTEAFPSRLIETVAKEYQ